MSDNGHEAKLFTRLALADAICRLLPHLNAERTANLIYDSEYGVKTEVLD